MHVSVIDPVLQTNLFVAFLVAAVLLTSKRDPKPHEMSHSRTDELKGAAILMVIFSHIGYFLFSNHKFMYPLSVAGGVGVNIFLFLSGFGLTASENKSHKSIWQFYSKRLKNIFVPMWLMLTPLLIFDFYLLKRTYSVTAVLQNVLGFFPNSDINTAINSPLWYFSLIFFYYLIFPLVYWRNRPFLSIFVILLLSFIATNLKLPVTVDILKVYKLHLLAFPLGMAFAWFNENKPVVLFREKLLQALSVSWTAQLLSYLLTVSLTLLFAYTAINSGVGEGIRKEQLLSLITTMSLVFISLIKNVRSNLLITLGKYSYEIYLIHWPLMYRYDFIYKNTSAFLGTLLYIAFLSLSGLL